MSLQPMQIADQINTPGYVAQGVEGETIFDLPARISPLLMSAVRVNAQVASELYYGGRQNDYTLEGDFGQLRLPYDSMWFEWQWPALLVIDGREVPAPIQLREAALLRQSKLADGGVRIDGQLFMQSPTRPVTVIELIDSVYADSAGNFEARTGARRDSSKLKSAGESQSDLLSSMNVAYLAMSLMNCKNVDIEEVDRPAPQAKNQRRRRKPKLSYHTISLPGMTSSSAHPFLGGGLDVMAIHRARGHFKTYTEEAPLLGRHVGTYWWGWQVRGSKKNGISVTDYKIGSSAS